MNCNRKDCPNAARWQIGFRAWAIGRPRTSVPLEAFTSLVVCDEHKVGVETAQILTPEGCARINNTLQSMRRAPADLTNAEVVFKEIVDGKIDMPAGMP